MLKGVEGTNLTRADHDVSYFGQGSVVLTFGIPPLCRFRHGEALP